MNKAFIPFALVLVFACTSQESRVKAVADQVMAELAAGDYEAVYEQSYQPEVERINEGGALVGCGFSR